MKKNKPVLQPIVRVRPTQPRDKIRLTFHPHALVEMFKEFKALFNEGNGEEVQSIRMMLEDVLKVLEWGEKRMSVKEETVELKSEKDESL